MIRFAIERLPDEEKLTDLPSCETCIEKQRQWQEKQRPKLAPVDRYWGKSFRLSVADKGRIKGCPRGWVYGCPLKEDSQPRSPLLLTIQAYYPYFKRGFTWEQFKEQPPWLIHGVQEMSAALARKQEKDLKKPPKDTK